MKKTFGKQAMRIMAAALVMVLLMVPMASGEQSAWDCPECGRTGNLWNYCGNCAHPAPWTKEEGFDEEKAYNAVLKQLEEIDGRIDSIDGKMSSKSWEPTSSDDTLLSYIINNCDSSVLPFSFIKTGKTQLSDTPILGEFAGLVIGNKQRLHVYIFQYNIASVVEYTRDIFKNEWLQSSWNSR